MSTATSNAETAQRLPWYQFSLRQMLVAFIFCGLLICWFTGRIKFVPPSNDEPRAATFVWNGDDSKLVDIRFPSDWPKSGWQIDVKGSRIAKVGDGFTEFEQAAKHGRWEEYVTRTLWRDTNIDTQELQLRVFLRVGREWWLNANSGNERNRDQLQIFGTVKWTNTHQSGSIVGVNEPSNFFDGRYFIEFDAGAGSESSPQDIRWIDHQLVIATVYTADDSYFYQYFVTIVPAH